MKFLQILGLNILVTPISWCAVATL